MESRSRQSSEVRKNIRSLIHRPGKGHASNEEKEELDSLGFTKPESRNSQPSPSAQKTAVVFERPDSSQKQVMDRRRHQKISHPSNTSKMTTFSRNEPVENSGLLVGVTAPMVIPRNEEQSLGQTSLENMQSPVFISRHKRSVPAQTSFENSEAERIKRRKQESSRILACIVESEQPLGPADLPDDCDSDSEGVEHEAWKLRELLRVKREYESDSSSTQIARPTSKQKYRFLQKYYHKGAFFGDLEDPVFQRDYNYPTERDLIDKTILPTILQVRNFGKMGKSKWTHLSAEDTTQFDGPWYKNSQSHNS